MGLQGPQKKQTQQDVNLYIKRFILRESCHCEAVKSENCEAGLQARDHKKNPCCSGEAGGGLKAEYLPWGIPVVALKAFTYLPEAHPHFEGKFALCMIC